ncbi:Lipase A [Paramyrothecium foliicola]|nr:Lipase A [Paramyrothecium foliicola]
MWRFAITYWLQLLALGSVLARAVSNEQHILGHDRPLITKSISTPMFASLERLARLVDIAYCIGTTGIGKPFTCVSRCNEFPALSLVTTWNTGLLLSDSCGYIAVDHGTPSDVDDTGRERQIEDQRAIIVAFRGTYSISNTIVDLSTIPQAYVPYPSPDNGGKHPQKPAHECNNCTAHMGFLESWRNARDLVLPELKALKAQYPTYPIRLVGHSLGGAVACLAALELKVSLGWEDVSITTFGEPRVGNHHLAHFIDEVFGLDEDDSPEQHSYRRVTHKDDPIPLLPLTEWGFASHAGEMFISKQDLSPTEDDLQHCVGDADPACSAGGDSDYRNVLQNLQRSDTLDEPTSPGLAGIGMPTRFKLWQLFFAHRDYFWRLGLCVPGGDPANWGRGGTGGSEPSEL